MPIISIDIPDDVKDRLEARAAQAGRQFDEFVASVLKTEADDVDYGGPPHLTVRTLAELEAKLDEAANDESVEATPEFWQAMRNRIAERTRKRDSA